MPQLGSDQKPVLMTNKKNKIKDIDFYHSNAVLIALLLPITLSFISLIVLSKIL